MRGTIHWLTHRDGPARALSVTPGIRNRLPRVLGKDGLVVWVTEADGAHALAIGGDTDGQPVPPRQLAAGAIGMVTGLAAAPDGSAVAVAARDGKLRVVDVGSGAVTELASCDDGDDQRPRVVAGFGLAGLVPAWPATAEPDPGGARRRR